MRKNITRIAIIGIFVLCGLLTVTAPDAAAKHPMPTPTPKPQPKEWQVKGVLAALNDELLGVQYEAIRKAAELGIADQIPNRLEIVGLPTKVSFSIGNNSFYAIELNNIKDIGAQLLWRLELEAIPDIPELIQLSRDQNPFIRFHAIRALGKIGEGAKEAVPELVNLLSNENENVRDATAWALGNIGESAQAAVPKLIRLLSDENFYIRRTTVWALGNIGESAQAAAPELIRLLADKNENLDILQAATEALGNLGEPAKAAVSELMRLLSDQDSDVRSAAAQALGKLGEPTKESVSALMRLLSDQDSDVRSAAAQALGNIGELAKDAVPELIRLLLYENLLEEAVQALVQIGTNDIPCMSFIIPIINRIYLEKATLNEQRFLAHFLGGGDPDAERFLTWLGKPANYPTTLNYDEARATLRVFKEAWQYTQDFPEVRTDLERQTAFVATQLNINWTPDDIPLLKTLLEDLENAKSTHADALRREIAAIEGRKWGVLAIQILGVHFAVWLLLLLLYPLSSHIQALLWQPLFRHLFGLYLPLLLTSAPFLKRWLLRPFRQVLLADAKLEQFDAARYFPEMEVAFPGQSATQPLFSVVPRLRGQIVIEGDSGLGKTMFARALLRRSRRAAVFLPAEKCVGGIVEAIHAKLPEVVADRRFLRRLVCGGALDLCIDGLNEVSADARAAITQFVERSFKGNVLLTTQPLEWQPPATARVFVLQPLRRDRIEAYLLSRYGLFVETPDAIGQTGYESACRAYLAEAFDSRQPPELLASNQRILSNPMDAVIVAQMLAHGETPSLFRLEEQQYTLMAADFARLHIGRAFPLAEFAERVYQMRLNDRAALPFEEFPGEIACMERHKMAVRRLVTERTRPNSAAPIAIETRRLPFELRRQIIAFLTALPNMQHQAAQQAFVNSLALDAPLKQGIKIGNASKEFFEMLVETLEGYGTLEDGRDPLEAMLKVAKESVGKERRAACDKLIEELCKIEIAPLRYNAPTPATPGEQWYFRHDKIMDYFLVQTFFGSENARPRKHLSDSRFRGVYFQLAALLPLDEARQLRETLIQYAADTKDHTVSDTFIQLLRPREILKT